jgi:hypothetical protein
LQFLDIPPAWEFLNDDVTKVGEGYEYAYFRTNGGLTTRMFDNPHISQKVRRWGRSQALGCS